MKARLLADGKAHRERDTSFSLSEVMTILILFQASGFRCLKLFYTQHVSRHLRREFPQLVSDNRFVELEQQALVPLTAFLHARFSDCTGISFVDSTTIKVCHDLRIYSHRVFKGLARRGKTSVGWFYGFKVHLVINGRVELLAAVITPGNFDDRRAVPKMVRRLFGDRGYISQELTGWQR
ncbi:MAG TPA: IS982 family transposase [Blastocatellia bacterium]|nr:IS982 family transposase [Blastocatellia bacterium]